jgi:hypothetical protein
LSSLRLPHPGFHATQRASALVSARVSIHARQRRTRDASLRILHARTRARTPFVSHDYNTNTNALARDAERQRERERERELITEHARHRWRLASSIVVASSSAPSATSRAVDAWDEAWRHH